MTNKASYWAVIPAAGLGLRMGAAVPKQYLTIHDKAILQLTIEKLLSCHLIEKVVVVLHPDDHYFAQLPIAEHDQIITTEGGDTRARSVLNGLNAIQSLANPQDWVLVHDAVRPCVSLKNIMHLINVLSQHSVGGLLGLPVTDSLKQVNDEGMIVASLPRDHVWRAQTPQLFRYDILLQSLQSALAEKLNVTDESMAMYALGYQPMMIEGHAHNIKITTQQDLQLAQRYIEEDECE